MGALLGEIGGDSFSRGPEIYERKSFGMGISPHGVSIGQLEWAPLLGTLGGFRGGVFLFVGALCREPGRKAPLPGTL